MDVQERPGNRRSINRTVDRREWVGGVAVALVILLAVVVLVVVLVVGFGRFEDCDGESGMRFNDKTNKECIGVTDGSYHFNDPGKAKTDNDAQVMKGINEVQDKIRDENKLVAKEKRYVKVVLLMPLTTSNEKDRDSALPLEQIRTSLEGSYAALRRANQTRAFGDPAKVKLQLLLANQGSRQEAGDDLVDDVLNVSDGDHRLVAVVGLGSSLPNTEVIARKLASRGIPMMSAITSADTLTGLAKLWSVSPSNEQYVQTLREFLDRKKGPKSGLIVYDRNRDPFANTLAAAFRSKLKPYLKFNEIPFSGGTLDQAVVSKIYEPVVTNICNVVPNGLNMVFYAGRVADFGAFAEALDGRVCRDRHLTVLTAATGFDAARKYANVLKHAKVSITYATSSDADAWGADHSSAPPDFQQFVNAYQENDFNPSLLSDGMAIAHHDAFAAVAVATRLATPGEDLPKPETVESQFPVIVLAYALKGASGRLSLPDSAQGRAIRTDKLPIRTLP